MGINKKLEDSMKHIFTSLLAICLFATGQAMADGNGLITKPSAHSVSVTVERLEKALAEKGIKVMGRVSHTKNATSAGLKLRPTELVIFGNPKLGTPLMNSQQTVGIDLPMKALVWEDANGKVWLTYNDPAYIASRHGVTDKPEVIKKMTGALKKFTDAATQP
jgi:uncharacterized protein (DUF302 family)